MNRLFIYLVCFCLLPVFSIHAQPVFEESECPFGEYEGHTVDCGTLIVPEDRSQPNSPEIRLAVAIIRAENPLPDPIIYLEGGPGGSALYGIDPWLVSPLGENRDVILIDQRGTGYSEPRLVCPDDEETADLSAAELAQICRETLESEGINLASYTSASNAADIADLIDALGYDQVNLYGVSYGTRLALTVLRDHPEHIRSVVLDSAFPPEVAGYDEQTVNAYRAFQQLFTDCAADSACNAAYPDLEAVLYEVVDSGNDQPFIVDLGEGEQEYTGDDFVNSLFELLYDSSALAYLPAVIYDAREGNFDLMADLEAGVYSGDEAEESLDLTVPADEEAFVELADDLLADYLGYDDLDAMYDDLDNMTDDEYTATYDDFINDMTDDDFIDLMKLFTGYEDDDEFFEYQDSLSDEEYDVLYEDFMNYLYGESMQEDVSDSDGMFNSVECYEEVPANDVDRASQLSEPLPDTFEAAMFPGVVEMFDTCAEWGVPAAGAEESQAVVSDVPTLVLAGNYDPITPPSWGRLAAETLTRSYFFEFPGVGHSVIDGGDCPVKLAFDFLDSPTTEPDSSCISGMSAPDFYTGD